MSSSASSWLSNFSSLWVTAKTSRISCFCSSFKGRCAAIVSARRPASSIPPSEVKTSGGIFLFNLTYWSNCANTVRRIASLSLSARSSFSTKRTPATNSAPLSSILSTCARCTPSTNTLTVPSGNLSICKILATQPMAYMSSADGSSLAADFCATNNMLLPVSIAVSKALIDFGRPTNNGITMCGKTTTSRSGSSGSGVVGFCSGVAAMSSDMFYVLWLSQSQRGGDGREIKTANVSTSSKHNCCHCNH